MAKKKSKKKAVKKALTNAEFSQKNELFNQSVELAKEKLGNHKNYGNQIAATTRQASKWRNKKGLVYKHSKGLIR